MPNPSFEKHDSCPDNWGQLRFANDWKAVQYTPDYFHKCATNRGVTIPSNMGGYQEGFNVDDSAYAGFGTQSLVDTVREFIGVALIDTLRIGTRYYVSFLISGNSNYNWQLCYCNKMGIKFVTNFANLTNPSHDLIDDRATLWEDTVMSDTSNWSVFKGSFIADSAYTGFVIGHFFHLANMEMHCYSSFGVHAYYYVDHVCVSTDSSTCNSTTSLPPEPENNPLTVTYSTSLGSLLIDRGESYSLKDLSMELFNSIGQLVLFKNVSIGDAIVGLPNLSAGIYVVRMSNKRFKILIPY